MGKLVSKSLMISLLLGASVALTGCGDDCDGSGRCDCCEKNSDCKDGLQCLGFFNSTGVFKRCATPQTSSCPK